MPAYEELSPEEGYTNGKEVDRNPPNRSGTYRDMKIVNGRLRRTPKYFSNDNNVRESNLAGSRMSSSTDEVPRPPYSILNDCRAVKVAILEKPLNILLLAVPVAIASEHLHWSDAAIFSLNFVAILPLAAVLGSATEELAASVGETLGGLLNATFGNAVEMILAVFALQEGLVDVVQGSLLGSILSNLLLVLGGCFLVGGIKFHTQRYNPGGARMQSSLLLLAVLALAVPTMVMIGRRHFSNQEGDSASDLLDAENKELTISRVSAIVLGVLYVMYLIFQIGTHPEEFTAEGEGEEVEVEMSAGCALIMLVISTGIVAVCSEALVGSVEGITETWPISRSFIGVVLLPIVGNAAEHATAVSVAYKNKMDLSLGVALGSSTQIALFVVPFTVIAGWMIDVPMDLNFKPVATGILLLTVLIVCALTSDGQSNWMEGVMLIAAYVLIAVAFYQMPKTDSTS